MTIEKLYKNIKIILQSQIYNMPLKKKRGMDGGVACTVQLDMRFFFRLLTSLTVLRLQ